MPEPVLVQFRFSHFNEKARWALDYKRVPHRRRTLLPGLHARAARKLTGKTTVPILVDRDQVVGDSTRIIAYLERMYPDPQLYPADERARERALALEDYFDEQVGPAVRQALFFLGRDDSGFAVGLFAAHKAPWQQLAYQGALLLNRPTMKRRLKLDEATFEESRRQIEAGLNRIEAEARLGGYLVGDAFSVADLTAASLLSPLARPPESPHPQARPDPPAVAEFRSRFEKSPGLEWVREMYRRHRGTSAALAE
jgi:glutathione S-transferase